MNWYKPQKIFLLVAACSIWSSLPFSVAANSLVDDPLKCKLINAAYQEVYSFEIENHYINICQQDNQFFYHRQSKLKGGTNILVRAKTIFGSNIYQANVGKTIYFAGLDGDRYYSSVMLNNNEIVFEPEIESFSTITASQSDSSVAAGYGQNNDNNLSNRSTEAEQKLVCIKDKSTSHPYLSAWQQLIGQSIVSANNYAVSNGYDFTYDRTNPNLALITTKKGATIDLGIASNSEVIEQVCIQPDLETESEL